MSTLLTILIATQGFTCLPEAKTTDIVDCLSPKAHVFVVTFDKDYDQSSQYEDMDRLCPHCKTIKLIKENK